jgi:16S rRNA (cytidine1402-2'-O)-methyltransferase
MDNTGTLWIVATPIGTLADLGQRARQVLAEVDLILAEDTRRARRLLSFAEVAVRGRLRSLHEHNEARTVDRIIADLKGGRDAAVISDAGTPALSDPGFLVVRAARAQGLRVCSVPGASVFAAALAAAGQPPLPATLVGFLPARRGPRRRRIGELSEVPWTLVFLLSPHRLGHELEDLAEGLGAHRPATLLAEISKLHERGLSLALGELVTCTEVDHPRGEYVVVVGPKDETAAAAEWADEDQVRAAYEQALAAGNDRRQALKEVARQTGLRRREVYAVLLATRDD